MPSDPTAPPVQSANRFSIYVPSPKTRLNLGKPDAKNQFGFPGISGLTDEHLYLEIGKYAHLTVGADVRFQGRGNWDQFATGNLAMSAMGTMTIGSKGKMILAGSPGAGKSPNFLANYRGSTPSWIDFNYLLLHYTVDGLHSRVKELFYGGAGGAPGTGILGMLKRTTPAWMKLHHASPEEQEAWWTGFQDDGTPPAGAPEEGMLVNATKKLWSIGLRTFTKARFDALKDGLSEDDKQKFKEPPGTLFIDHVTSEMKWNPRFISASLNPMKWKTSDYAAFLALDPYAPTEYWGGNAFALAVNKAQAWLTQVVVYVRRLTEAMEIALGQLENNIVFDKIRSLPTALKSMGDQITLNMTDWSNQLGKAFQSENYALAADRWAKGFDGAMGLKAPSTTPSAAVLEGGSESFDVLAKESDYTLQFRSSPGGDYSSVDLASLALPATLVLTLALPAGDATPALGGATLAVVASGKSPVTVALDSLVGGSESPTPESMAAALAKLLGGQTAFSATASGATVTLTTTQRGAGATLVVTPSSSAAKALGLVGTAAAPFTSLSGDDVLTVLQGLVGGSAVVKLLGESPARAVNVTSTTSGNSSYLEFKGALATTIFGSNPAIASGADAFDSTTGFTKWTNYLIGATRLSTPLQQAAQPVFETMQQLGDTLGKFDAALKSIQKVLFGASSIPSVGIVSGKGGLSLASMGKLTGSAHSVVWIAHGKASNPPNNEKQTIFETLVTNPIYVLNKKLEDAMEVDSMKRPSLASEGSIAAFSNGFINMVSERSITMLSLQADVRLVGTNTYLHGTSNLELTAHGGTTKVQGKAIEIGTAPPASAEMGAPPVTTGVNVVAGQVRLAALPAPAGAAPAASSEACEVVLSPGNLAVIATDAAGAGGGVPLLVSATASKLGVADARADLDAAAGEACLAAKTRVQLQVGGNQTVDITAQKTLIGGDVDFGGVLTIKGTKAATVTEVAAKQKAANAALRKLESEYQATLATLAQVQAATNKLEKKIEDLYDGGKDERVSTTVAEVNRAKLEQQRLELLAKLREDVAVIRGLGGSEKK